MMVPKGRFELPCPYGHYALNVARLPFRHFGLLGAACSLSTKVWGNKPWLITQGNLKGIGEAVSGISAENDSPIA
ncbi:unnamed protein product [marine sediment metagenome]|uniref:Uncharacterized protein n=2 Tax=marine sediment metagenome TaxID=412755 RepID=X1S7G7_9ZZZZ